MNKHKQPEWKFYLRIGWHYAGFYWRGNQKTEAIKTFFRWSRFIFKPPGMIIKKSAKAHPKRRYAMLYRTGFTTN